jgi:deoxyribodipyrimidine photo-lyase
MEKVNIFWFRRDLRLHDNHGLYEALKQGLSVVPIFIFDKLILDKLPNDDKRVVFIHQSILNLQSILNKLDTSIHVYYSTPEEVFKLLLSTHQIHSVFTNHDYEPYAQQRDAIIAKMLLLKNVEFNSYKDQVIFEKNEVVKDDGKPYTVFTPFSKKWKAKLQLNPMCEYRIEEYSSNFSMLKSHPIPTLFEMGFDDAAVVFPSLSFNEKIILDYHDTRDFPAIGGTTQLSVHLRFGTISIRQLAKVALSKNEKFLNELIWRDFYQTIIFHFPHVVSASFRPQYDAISWRNNEQEFDAWCNGLTGYPIVDAGMRELNTTGWMHNRVRMIVASFLTKHLLIDWRWGEAYFAQKLLDFDLASNNGGWQWAAGSGVDAAPYFRIFNPYTQTIKFDSKLAYIKKWVPEFESFSYPKPIVVHDVARKRCLDVYKAALKPE